MVEEKELTKSLYKVELYIIKIIPMVIAGCYFMNTTLSYFGIDVPLLSLIGGTSIITLLFIYLSSFVFKFCFYHRLPIYYAIVSDIIAYYDMYIGVPVSNRTLFSINMIIAGVFLFLIIYFKFYVKHPFKRKND